VRRRLLCVGIAAGAALRGAAWAGPTGLAQIPTTDLVPWRQVNAVLQNGNATLRGDESILHRPEPVPQAEVGLPWNAEGGIDVVPEDRPEDYRPLLNLKWRPLDESYRRPAVALGAAQLGVGFQPTLFLVASKTLDYEHIQYQKFRAHHRNIKLRGIRVHTGLLRTASAWRAMIGTDVELSDHFVLWADWISGGSNAVSLGGVIVFNRADSLALAALRGNHDDRVSGIVLMATHTFDW
jgi:hypothetical protein